MDTDEGGLFPRCTTRFIYPESNIEEMIDFFESVDFESVDDESPSPLGCFFPFALTDTGGELSINMNIKDNSYNVVQTEWGCLIATESENFEKFLFQSAFFNFVRYAFFAYFSYSNNKTRESIQCFETNDIFEAIQEIADDIAKKHAMHKIWFSDSYQYIAAGADIAFIINRAYDNTGGYGFITGQDKKMGADILDSLESKLAFSHMRPR